MEENNDIKITNVVNLPTINVKTQTTFNTDSNTHIKQILNIETCLISCQIEPMSSKALLKGEIGIKVVYIDADNMCGSISDSLTFTETVNNDSITTACDISVYNSQFVSEYENDEQNIKISIDGTIDCLCSLNNALNSFNHLNDKLIAKKTILKTYCPAEKINKSSSYDSNFRLNSKISKILSCDSKVVVDEAKCLDGYILVSGNIYTTILYECTNPENNIKVANTSTSFKSEIEAKNCKVDCVADIAAYINLNSTQITTEINENDTQFNFEYCIVVSGNIYNITNIDIISDIYSTENEIEPITKNYITCTKSPYYKSSENIDAEITLADELNIDEILGMINTSATITNHSINNGNILLEGVISGNLMYLNENHEIKHLFTQLPYSVNVKQDLQGDICAMDLSVIPIGCKCKIKRGNSLVIDYEVSIIGSIYEQNSTTLIHDIKIGKPIQYNDIAFQIYVAHPNESCWDLCKRLHISQEKLLDSNNENTSVYAGGEKIIVYR